MFGQISALKRIHSRVSTVGPESVVSDSDCLHDIVKARDLYSGASCSVRPYEPAKFKVLSPGVCAKPLYDRLPACGRQLMDACETAILRPQRELDASPTPVNCFLYIRIGASA